MTSLAARARPLLHTRALTPRGAAAVSNRMPYVSKYSAPWAHSPRLFAGWKGRCCCCCAIVCKAQQQAAWRVRSSSSSQILHNCCLKAPDLVWKSLVRVRPTHALNSAAPWPLLGGGGGVSTCAGVQADEAVSLAFARLFQLRHFRRRKYVFVSITAK